jgi:hypothetical protein
MIRGQNENLKKKQHKIAVAYTIISIAIIGVGAVHTLLTFVDYTGLSEEAVWFATSGLAVVTIGLLNYIVVRTQGRDRAINSLSYIINAFGITMLILAFIALNGEPQPIILVLLLVSAAILALKMSRFPLLKEHNN